MPLLYGELGLTGDEIGRLSPWEIDRRLEGFGRRQKNKRLFTASFVTAPIINSGHPKHPVTARKLIPADFRNELPLDDGKVERLKKLANKIEGRRNRGRS
ncbi:MAG: alkaline phosphatase family protein [Selenomonas sp.]|uniref:hypothetical protein n=1 Tax=Selenomonas sp. TaxID=2053611 RepID=UPI0025D8A480|nr:hypothetical protein [Selenomonas sp.]MCR5440261.1 alkaline phosphatase family protein [Selenomonas sp.]